MSEQTKIAWCDDTVNPVHGCDKVSAGCANCYITTTTPFRISGMKHGDPRTFHPNALKLAEKLNRKPWICDGCGEPRGNCVNPEDCICQKCEGTSHHSRRIFWESLGDFLDPKWNIESLAQTLDTIRRCDQCTHILVSKRWENWEKRIDTIAADLQSRRLEFEKMGQLNPLEDWLQSWLDGDAPSNIIGLCSVENQEMADKRIPQFLTVPLACHGLSMEPLLGPVDLSRFIGYNVANENAIQRKLCVSGGKIGRTGNQTRRDDLESSGAKGKQVERQSESSSMQAEKGGDGQRDISSSPSHGGREKGLCSSAQAGIQAPERRYAARPDSESQKRRQAGQQTEKSGIDDPQRPDTSCDSHAETSNLEKPQAISWLIIGGESGKNARPCNVDWIRSLVAQGKAAGVATFVKQFSGRKAGEQGELPDELFNIKQFPSLCV